LAREELCLVVPRLAGQVLDLHLLNELGFISIQTGMHMRMISRVELPKDYKGLTAWDFVNQDRPNPIPVALGWIRVPKSGVDALLKAGVGDHSTSETRTMICG
jgi:hypothetical protein